MTPTDDPLLAVVLAGLASAQKTLPPTLFYDAVGSALFDRITTLDEYYVTRAEAEILHARGPEIARAAADGAAAVVVIEPGCGSADKVAALLRHLPAAAWVGLDVSPEALASGAAAVAEAFPGVEVHAVTADYHVELPLPELPDGRRVAFFPGSTIGNFDPREAAAFLSRLGRMVGPDGKLIVGIDLWKDPEVLRAAYDDREGVTAAFDKNALAHLNARYDADFDLDRFEHLSRVDPVRRRVEMHLRATTDQVVTVAGQSFRFASGETIHTENAYKYAVDDFASLGARAGLVASDAWTDRRDRFAVVVFSVDAERKFEAGGRPGRRGTG